MSAGHGVGGGDGEAGDMALVQNLQQQLDLATQEKEAAQEKWREAVQEVDRLEAELEMEKESHQWRVVEQQAHQVKEQYQQSVAALNAELESLHTQLRESRSENNQLLQKVTDLKMAVNDLQQKLIWKAQENADTIFKEGLSDSKIYELKTIMDDLSQRLAEKSQEASDLRRENSTFSTRVMELQKRLSDTEVRENEAITQIRDAVQMVEAAVMEKDQFEIMAKKKDDELEEMKNVLAKIINKAGARTREEVDLVRKQCNDRITLLTEELHGLEMEGAEKQSRLDRLLREKRSIESELQQIYKEGKSDISKSKEAYQLMSKRAIDAERARDEANTKVDNLLSQIDLLTLENKQIKHQMGSEVKQLQERLTSVQSEFEAVNEDRLSSLNKVNDLNKKLLACQQEKEAVQRKFAKELALIEQNQQMKSRDFEVKLQTTEDSRRQTVSELRRLLTAQQRMSARWKEECQTVTHKFQGQLEDLRSELSHVKKRNEELSSLLKDSQIKTCEVERLLSDYTRNIRRMEERVREAELQAGEAHQQLARQSIRERQGAAEKESLLAELTRSQRGDNPGTDPKDLAYLGSSVKVNGILRSSNRGDLTLEHLSNSVRQETSQRELSDR
ncbi:sodium channel and clathrin linker 1-like [Physella acuta]|uniref:sodium channel and clathrin linker 1-like n=1 Tax=Physella acuta TaxID=109671 RepID=UPI0027DC9F9C|nr:sodium channel and clathrin linker 1-like [Physella acuta]